MPEQIGPPQCTYMFHCTLVLSPCIPHITLYISKKPKLELLFTMLLPYMFINIYASKCTCMPNMPIRSCAGIKTAMSVYIPHSSSQLSKLSHKHWYTYSSHYWHMTLKNMTLTAHKYALLP